MWFKKKKKEVSGITLEEWMKSHIDDKEYLRVYVGKEGTFSVLDTFSSVKDISYGIVEKYKNNPVSTVEVVYKDTTHDVTLVFIEE